MSSEEPINQNAEAQESTNKETEGQEPANEEVGEKKDGAESSNKKEDDMPTRRFNGRTTAAQVLADIDLAGTTAIVTGANSGIGIETARSLALKNAQVVMMCRNVESAQEVRNKIVEEKGDARVEIIKCDLNSLASVKEAADNFIGRGWPLQILILNAGVFTPPNKLTEDGYEAHFGVNHLGHFYLTQLLLPVLERSTPARLVVVSSGSHADIALPKDLTADKLTLEIVSPTSPLSGIGFRNGMMLYGQSKLCNVWFANCFDRKYKDQGITAYSLHPGTMISTGIARSGGFLAGLAMKMAKLFNKSLEQGAATTVYCAVAPELKDHSGRYFQDCWFKEASALAMNEELQEKLWQISEEEIEKFKNKPPPTEEAKEEQEKEKVKPEKPEETEPEETKSEETKPEENGSEEK